MNHLRKYGLLPHELFFGLFLIVMFLRLLFVVGPTDRDTLVYGVLIVVNVALIAWSRGRDSGKLWWARLWYYPVVINVVFMNMKASVMKLNSHKWDDFLAGIDESLFGALLSVRAEALITPWLTEILSFCYLLFFPYLLFSCIYYAWRGQSDFRKLSVGLFTIYGIGFLGYAHVPAGGPHLAFPELFHTPLGGWAVSGFNAYVVEQGSNGVDVFPSLHCGVTFFLLMFDRVNARWRYRLYLVPFVGILAATIYLRYHYFIDLIIGFLLASFALWIVRRWEASPSIDPQPETN